VTPIVALVLVASGCQVGVGNSAQDAPVAYSAWARSYIESLTNLNDFERQVLADFVVTDDEYREAQELLAQCMEARGFLVSFGSGYSTEVTAAPSNPGGMTEADEVFNACQQGTLFHVQPVYLENKYNPQGLSLNEKIRTCLDELDSELVIDMSDEQLTEFATQVAVGAERVSAAEAVCVMDPSGIWGATEENVAEMYGWNH